MWVGPWLPEPMLTSPDVAEDVALADSVSTAMLLVLETLTPIERAVFVLGEAFGYSTAEIARFVGSLSRLTVRTPSSAPWSNSTPTTGPNSSSSPTKPASCARHQPGIRIRRPAADRRTSFGRPTTCQVLRPTPGSTSNSALVSASM